MTEKLLLPCRRAQPLPANIKPAKINVDDLRRCDIPLFNRSAHSDASGNHVWPKMPHQPISIVRPQQQIAPRRAMAYVDAGKTPLELLSRLAGGTTYRTPDTGRSTRTGGAGVDDLAHALGFVTDPLEQRLALALACRTDAEWPQVQELATPQLRRMLLASHQTRAMVAGAMRYRIRLVLHDVFHDLALARPPRLPRQSAKRLQMPVRDYKAMYKAIAGFVETRAHAGAHEAIRALFSE
jgi:hypothetical protein